MSNSVSTIFLHPEARSCLFFAPRALLPSVGREYPLARAYSRILEGFGTHSAGGQEFGLALTAKTMLVW